MCLLKEKLTRLLIYTKGQYKCLARLGGELMMTVKRTKIVVEVPDHSTLGEAWRIVHILTQSERYEALLSAALEKADKLRRLSEERNKQ